MRRARPRPGAPRGRDSAAPPPTRRAKRPVPRICSASDRRTRSAGATSGPKRTAPRHNASTTNNNSTTTTGAPCRHTSSSSEAHVRFRHEHDVIAGAKMVAAASSSPCSPSNSSRYTNGTPFTTVTLPLPTDTRAATRSHRRFQSPRRAARSSSQLAWSNEHTSKLSPVATPPRAPRLVFTTARRSRALFSRSSSGSGASRSRATPLHCSNASLPAEQRGVDDEPPAAFDPTLELRAACAVDVPAPRRKHDDSGAARRTKRLAALVSRAQRCDELLCSVERVRGGLAARRRRYSSRPTRAARRSIARRRHHDR